jgi:hypothetical protein
MNMRSLRQFNQTHAALTSETFAASVQGGRHVSGRELSTIMPRFELNEVEMRGLQAYLKQLSSTWSPGVTDKRLSLATVITPDVTPERREVFLKTLKAAVEQKNANFSHGMRTMSTASEMMFRTNRIWDLQVWQLEGSPETWGAQMDRWQEQKPVFALLSGVGADEWTPVHRFCESQQVPCWFPSVRQAPDVGNDMYGLYFQAGAAMEAKVLVEHFKADSMRQVLQVTLGDAPGLESARQLRQALAVASEPATKLRFTERTLYLDGTAGDSTLKLALRRALASAGSQHLVVLWLPRERLALLDDVAPPAGPRYLSARMTGADAEALPANWKQPGTNLVYPYQLPDMRKSSLFYMHAWLRERKLPEADEALQSEVYFAVNYFSDTVTDMLDNLHADYLVERGENMLSVREGQKAEDEARELMTAKHQKGPTGGGAQGAGARLAALEVVQERRIMRPLPGRKSDVFLKREGTSIYPRLSLAPGQRYASKGAFVVSFDAQTVLVPVSDWIVP